MRRKNDCIREFKNGNINIKYDRHALENDAKDEILTIAEVLSGFDCVFIGDTYCISNFETGHTVYNYYSDCCYVFPWKCLEDLRAKKTVKLYARPVDKDDRELFRSEYLNEE